MSETTGSNILLKALGHGLKWPALAMALTYWATTEPSQLCAPLTFIPSIFSCALFKVCNWTISFLAIPSLIIILAPYFWFLVKGAEGVKLAKFVNIYSGANAGLGALAILGMHA